MIKKYFPLNQTQPKTNETLDLHSHQLIKNSMMPI